MDNAPELTTYRLTCPKCEHTRTWRWPNAWESKKPEFVVCDRCYGPISTIYDSVPNVHHLQGKKRGVEQSPEPLKDYVKKPELVVSVMEGGRPVTEVSLDRLVDAIWELERLIQEYCWEEHRGRDEDVPKAWAKVDEQRAEIFRLLGVKQA